MRGMKLGLAKGAVFLGALVGVSSAFAAAGDIVVTVAPISDGSTYSRPSGKANDPGSQAVMAFTVVVTSISGNTINKVNFEGATVIKTLSGNAVTDKVAPFLFAEYAAGDTKTSCSPVGPGSASVTCTLGQYRGLESRTFKLFFVAPEEAVLPTSVPPSVNVFLEGKVLHAEGPNGGNSEVNSISYWAPASVLVGEAVGGGVKSLNKRSGNRFYTGFNGVPGYSFPDANDVAQRDDFATTLTVPSAVKLTKTALTEATFTCASTNFTKCASLDLQIVDIDNTTAAFNFSPNYLTIVLRMDKENILTNNIRSVVLTYKYFDAQNSEQTHVIGDCANATTPRSDGLPCIASSKYYRTVKKTDDPALVGDFEWSLISLKNGRFNIE